MHICREINQKLHDKPIEEDKYLMKMLFGVWQKSLLLVFFYVPCGFVSYQLIDLNYNKHSGNS